MKNSAIFGVKLAVTCALFWLIADGIDLERITRRLGDLSYDYLLAACFFTLSQMILASLRWNRMLVHYNVPLPVGSAIRLTWEGAFFNQALPSAIGGDAVKVYRARHYNMTTGVAVSSILLDRVAGLFALLLLSLAAVPAILPLENAAVAQGTLMFSLTVGFGAMGGLVLFPCLPRNIREFKLLAPFSELGRKAATFLLKPATALPLTLLSIIGHICTILAAYAISQAMGLAIPVTVLGIIIPTILLVTMIPVSVGGWGVREGAMIQGLALFAVAADDALLLSVLFGLINIIVNIPGGLLWLAARQQEKPRV